MNDPSPPVFMFAIDVKLSDPDDSEPVHYIINYWAPVRPNLLLQFDADSRELIHAEVIKDTPNV